MSDNKIVLGTPGMIPQPVRRSYVQGRGWQTTLRWEGEKQFAGGLEQQCIAAGYDTSRIDNGPNSTLEATIGARDDNGAAEEVPEKQWEVAVNRETKSIYEHPSVAALGDEKINILKEALKKDSGADVDPTGDMAIAYGLLLRGVDTMIVEQSVIRLTQTVSNRYSARQVATNNIGKLFTREQMISLEGAPPEVFIDDETEPADFGVSVMFAYRKAKPSMQKVAGNKWQLIFEYESGLWSDFLYANAS